MLKKLGKFIVPVGLMTPVTALAVTEGIHRLIDQIQVLIHRLIPVIIGLGLLAFLWGVLKFLFAKDDDKKTAGRKFMLWGIVALFVMVSVWGLVEILSDTIFTETRDTAPSIPRIPKS